MNRHTKISNTEKTKILHVRDLTRSNGFYRCLLNIDFEHNEPGLFTQIRVGKQVFRLVQASKKDKSSLNPSTLQISVPDMDRWLQQLNKRNIPYSQQESADDQLFEVVDPDGNTIIFSEEFQKV